jgi:hypothetical protein
MCAVASLRLTSTPFRTGKSVWRTKSRCTGWLRLLIHGPDAQAPASAAVPSEAEGACAPAPGGMRVAGTMECRNPDARSMKGVSPRSCARRGFHAWCRLVDTVRGMGPPAACDARRTADDRPNEEREHLRRGWPRYAGDDARSGHRAAPRRLHRHGELSAGPHALRTAALARLGSPRSSQPFSRPISSSAVAG